MADTPTPRLGLYKSDPDGDDLVNYGQDVGGNMDKLDAAVGYITCTSTSRPASPWVGMPIRETDTGRFYVCTGTGPAVWTEIMTPGVQLTFTNSLIARRASGTNPAFRTQVVGDTTDADRMEINANGRHRWGPGAAVGTFDTVLERTAAGVLDLSTGDLRVQGTDRGRGVIARISRSASISVDNTDNLIMTIPSRTYVNGRAYRFQHFGYPVSASDTAYALFRLKKTSATGTVVVDRMRTSFLPNGQAVGVSHVFNLLNNSGADITVSLVLTLAINGTAGASYGTSDPTSRSYIVVEDIGLASQYEGHPLT